MKRLFFVIIILLGITTSCTKNFEDFNTDKKRPVEVPGETLFANAQKALADQEASTSVNLNVWKLWAQQWTETTYTDEANYDIVNRNIANSVFQVYYRNILMDLREARLVIDATVVDGTIAETEKKNRLYIIDVLEVYCYAQLLETFGDVPYTEALDINNIYPKYDDALTVYKDLLTRLSADVAGMDDSQGSFGDADLYMGGDVAMWKKFANSMKVRIGITIADGDNATAKAAVESGYAGAFAPDESCRLVYLDATNSNPLYQDMVQSGRDDFIPANTIVDIMNGLFDTRILAYFSARGFSYERNSNNQIIDTDLAGEGKCILIYRDYLNDNDSLVQVNLPFTALAKDSANVFTYNIGGAYGESSAFTQYSHVAAPIQEPIYPSILIDGTEVSFYLAEAAERGYSVGGTAAEYYNKGVTASFTSWGLAGDAAAYLAKPEVAYTTATGTWKQKIGLQAYLAYHVRGLVAYTTWRRLDFPILNLPPSITSYSEIPVRFTYPTREQTINGTNYAAAASAIGGDELTTKLFWDKF